MHKKLRALSRLFHHSKVTKTWPIVETMTSDNQPLSHPENFTQLILYSVISPEAIACMTNMLNLPHELHLEIFEVVQL
jgi:hypothetical protein